MRIALVGLSMRQWGTISPACLTEDLPSPAGTELALLGIAKALAERGHQVKAFLDCEAGVFDGVEYYRPEMILPLLTTIDHDVVVSWGDASIFLYPIKARLKVVMNQSSRMGNGQAEDKVDRYFAISRTSAQMLLDSDPYADPSKMWITRNGILPERFAAAEGHPRNPHQIVWLSSPDRGLHHLVDIFKLVKQEIPDATLVVAYDFDRADKSYQQNYPGATFIRFLDKARQLKEMDGVSVVQHLSQPKLAELLMSSGMMVYPCDPVHATETYCTSVTEALAAGLAVVLSDADCLPENYGHFGNKILPRPIDTKQWADTIIEMMKDGDDQEIAQQNAEIWLQNCDLRVIAEEWEDLFDGFLTGRSVDPDKSLAAKLGK